MKKKVGATRGPSISNVIDPNITVFDTDGAQVMPQGGIYTVKGPDMTVNGADLDDFDVTVYIKPPTGRAILPHTVTNDPNSTSWSASWTGLTVGSGLTIFAQEAPPNYDLKSWGLNIVSRYESGRGSTAKGKTKVKTQIEFLGPSKKIFNAFPFLALARAPVAWMPLDAIVFLFNNGVLVHPPLFGNPIFQTGQFTGFFFEPSTQPFDEAYLRLISPDYPQSPSTTNLTVVG